MRMMLTVQGWRGSPKAGPGARAVRRVLLVLGLVAGTLSGAVGARAEEGGLALTHPWFRLVMPSLPAAGYFTLSIREPRRNPWSAPARPAAAC